MLNMKKSKKDILPTILLALFLLETFANGITSNISKLLYIGMILSFIGSEVFERQQNKKKIVIRNKNVIAEIKNGDYYLGIFVCLVIVTIYLGICALGNTTSSVFSSTNLGGNSIVFAGLTVLLSAYGYFYFTSKLSVYAEGIVLANNKFISTNDFVDIAFRDTLIKKKKLIEITIKEETVNYTNTIRIKCKDDDEFERVVVLITRITGIYAKKV